MQLTLQTITPVHVGNGEELYDLDYAIHGGYYYRISQKTVEDFLKKSPELVTQYTEWIVENTNEMDDLKQSLRNERDRRRRGDFNQQLNRIRRDFNVVNFAKSIQQTDAFIRHLNASPNVYKIPYDGKLGGQIRGAIKTATGKPYIPGTSLKGAIRTALLYHFLSENNHAEDVRDVVQFALRNARQNPRRQRFIIKTFADKLEHLAFYCHTKKDNKIKRDDEKFDLLKLLKVSDGHLPGTPDTTMRLADVQLYLVSKVKKRDSREFDIKATEQPQAPFVEAVKEGTPIGFKLDIDLNFLLQFKTQFEQNQVVVGKDKDQQTHWIGIIEKVKSVFGLDLRTLTTENLEAKKNKVYDYIFDCLHKFTQKQIGHQKEWLDNFIKHDKARRYDVEIEDGHQPLFALTDKRLIHFGFGTGFTGITEYLHLLDTPELRTMLKEMMELFLIGDKPGANNRRTGSQTYVANLDKFPKSRRLVRDEDRIQPMGWGCILKAGEQLDIALSSAANNEPPAPPESIKVEFFTGTLNPKKRPEINAEVIYSGRPNKVKVYVSEDYTPEIKLDGYRNPIEKGKIIIVEVSVSKKKQITQASFKREKK